MAKKGKAKISKVKRNNQTTNKMKKQGKLKLQRHRAKVQKQSVPERGQQEDFSESEASGEEWADMLDDEEQQYILSRLSTQPQLLSNVPEQEKPNKSRSRKRKRDTKEPVPRADRMEDDGDSGAESEESVEDKYEKEQAARPAKKVRPLLPIKTKEGLQDREEKVDDSDDTESQPESEQPTPSSPQHSDSDSGLEGTGEETEEPLEKEVTTVELLAARRNKLQHDKLRIGALCSSLLESPEKKLKNLFPVLYLMEERLKDGQLNLHSVRKIATLSACEVFKDILPEYHIRHQDYSNVKLKKDTLALYKFEKELLEFYKRYLQRLEKATGVLRRKKGDNRKPDEASINLALISLRCMCAMLVAKPNFNFATNIAQSVVPFLDCRQTEARDTVNKCCTQVFSEDFRGEITLAIVRLINQLVKRRSDRLHPSALDCLMTLRIRDVDLNEETDIKNKKKKEEKHKKRIINLSKKEKKRNKKLKEVERELLETEAQESEVARKKLLTEVTKTVFMIYFRLLKTAPTSKLLTSVLNGLAKFTHVINLEFYTDLVAILGRLVSGDLIDSRNRLQCVKTALAVLAGAGDALNVDPARFHTHLYSNALNAHAGVTQEDARIIIEAISQIAARARRVSSAVLQAFAKRLATLTIQLQHHGSLAALALLQQLITQNKSVSHLLEPEPEAGSGRFDPNLESPEHCNANSAALHELCVLKTHYHPTVRDVTQHILAGKLPQDLHKMTPIQAYEAFDGSQMAFKPSIPPPKKDLPKAKVHANHLWAQPTLGDYCKQVEDSLQMVIDR